MANNIFVGCSTRVNHCLVTVVLKVAMTTWNGLIPRTAGTASRENTDAIHLVRRAADGLRTLVPQAHSAAIALLGDDDALHLVLSSTMVADHHAVVLHRATSLAGEVLRSGTPLRCDDVDTDDRVDRIVAHRLGVRSMLEVPLLHNGEVIGLILVGSARTESFTDEDLRRCEAVAGVVTMLVATAGELVKLTGTVNPNVLRNKGVASCDIDAVTRFVSCLLDPALADLAQLRQRIEQTIAASAMDIVLQPVVDLATSTLVSVEALARFTGPPRQAPDRWFAEAERVGLGSELEVVAASQAIRLLELIPEPVTLSINVGPSTLDDPCFVGLVMADAPKRIIIELTEHIPVDNYQALIAGVQWLRHHGVRLAVDDAGAGYASFAHIIELAPELIKLDRSLIADIATDPVRRALAGALVGFAHQSGARVVAEGIETAHEFAAAADLGIDYGQGFYLGRPEHSDDLFSVLSTSQRSWRTAR